MTATGKFFVYKEGVATRLQELGVPREKAELAVIDLKSYVNTGFLEKKFPQDIARIMLSEVRRIYRV